MKPLIFKIPVIALAISFVIVAAYQYNQATSHSVNAFDSWVDMFFYGLAIIAGLVGMITLVKGTVRFKPVIILVYVLLVGGSFVVYNIATAEDKSPIILQGSTGDVVGGLCLMFRKDSTFRIINSGGVGYFWEDGKYSLSGNNILLDYMDKYNVADLNRAIVINADTLYYAWKGDTSRKLMQIVLNNLNKK